MGSVPNVGLDGKGQAPVAVRKVAGRGLPPSSVGQKKTNQNDQRVTMTSGQATPKPQGYGY